MATEILRPNGDSYAGWTRSTGSYNYALVDEAVKDEADYVYTSADLDEDYYELTAPSVIQPTDTINSVTIHAVAKYVTGDRQIYLGYDKGSGAVYSAVKSLTTSYAEYTATFTGITYANLAGLVLVIMAGEESGTVYVCQAWAEVDYTVPSTATFGGGSFHRGVGRGFF